MVQELPLDRGDMVDMVEVERFEHLRDIDLHGGENVEMLNRK